MFTYDLNTDVGRVRLLIADTSAASPRFQDAELQAFISTTCLLAGVAVPNHLRAAALALEAWSRDFMNADVSMGDYRASTKETARAMMELAARYRAMDEETPAWGVVEENLSSFNELAIIRNFILRSEA